MSVPFPSSWTETARRDNPSGQRRPLEENDAALCELDDV
jgi:hypothetical protein